MKKIIISALALTAFFSCKKNEDTTPANASPVVTLEENSSMKRLSESVGDYKCYFASATDSDGKIVKVVFYANNVPFDTVQTPSTGTNKYYADECYEGTTAGTVKFHAVALDDKGATGKSNEISVVFEANEEVMVEEVKVK
jgi:hypothetical protein